MKNTNVDIEVLNKIYNLYVMDTKHYIQQNKYGIWKTINTVIDKEEKPLLNYKFKMHINGYNTMGTFSGKVYSKFLCFDVDYADNIEMAKWMTYKVCNELRENGINDYYISFSGGKGYHIELFFEDLIDLDTAKKFYNYIIYSIDANKYKDKGDIEFRPSSRQAVKIPLGIQHKTGKFCGYCLEENGLKVMTKKQSLKYLLTVKKINRQTILDILNIDVEEIKSAKETIKTERVVGTHKDLKIYNETMEEIEQKVIDLIQNGLKCKGSRHNSLLYIAMFYNGCGETQEQIEQDLIDWIEQQNKEMYTTKMEECKDDIHKIVEYVIKHNSCIRSNNIDLTVSKNELDFIITNCKTVGEKKLAYAMLIHSKRFANKKGIFYMTQAQMSETTGMTDRNARNVIKKLIGNKVIEGIELNRKIKGSYLKLPNKYNVLFKDIKSNTSNITYLSDVNKNLNKDLNDCLSTLYTKKQLKTILSRRQLESLIA